jgi:hypothetical protein
MKRILFCISFALTTYLVDAQAPQSFTFQAVVRNNSNILVSNSPVGVRISILQGDISGPSVYIETHLSNTNTNGLLTLAIGNGTVVNGFFSSINWGNGPYFIKTETDPTGGTNYTIIGTSQLMSVPYALYAENSGTPGPQGNPGADGIDGNNGLSAYQIWLNLGNTGTEADFIASLTGPQGLQGPAGNDGTQGLQGLPGTNGLNGTDGVDGNDGLSAYQIWLNLGNTGTEADFIASLTGPQGIQGLVGPQGLPGTNGTNGLNGADGVDGNNGLSAYQIWLNLGNTGTEVDFIASLTGPQGLQGPTGNDGAQGLQGLPGTNGLNGADGVDGNDGLSAYQSWLNLGNTGTEVDFIASLTGPQGIQGPAGNDGAQGLQGLPGTNGLNGADGVDGNNGLSAYQIWLNLGNTGTEADFIASLTGPQGIQGPVGPQGLPGTNGTNGLNGADGVDGNNGLSAYQIWLNLGNTGTEADFTASLTGPQGVQGPTGSTGSTGVTGPQGVPGNDGSNGLNSLVKTTLEGPSMNCFTGGVKYEFGLDANNNGILDVSEINATQTKYVCNGKNAISRTTPEAAGPNCSEGGVKLELGTDLDGDSYLDAVEVSSVQYICNGAQGATGPEGPAGPAGAGIAQTLSIIGNNISLSDGGGSITILDNDPSNEIELPTGGSDSDILILNGGNPTWSGEYYKGSRVYVGVDSISRMIPTTWTLGPSFIGPSDFKANSYIEITYSIPARSNATGWGGYWIEPQISFDGGGTWLSLGSSGFDGNIMNNTSNSVIGTYTNTLLINPGLSNDFSVNFRFYYRSYAAFVEINSNHSINTISGTAPRIGGGQVQSAQHFTHVIIKEILVRP